MLNSPANGRQLPYGVADLYYESAARKTRLERQFAETFERWSYSQVIPPTFEYDQTLSAQASPQVVPEIYRFPDRDGTILALRADPTIPIARLIGAKLSDRPVPLRLYYVANVFRHEEPKAALRREFTQAGVELVGVGTPQADAEVIALAVETLRAGGLADFRLRVGAMDLLDALIAPLDLSAPLRENLRLALERKNSGALAQVLKQLDASPQARDALTALPSLVGDTAILDQASRTLALHDVASSALARLREMWQTLLALDVGEHVSLDLGMVRGMAYYTGIVFEGFARGLGFPLLSGGRYNNLLAHFGPPLPACGFAVGVERALAALEHQQLPDLSLAPAIIAPLTSNADLARRVAQARAQGTKVEWVLDEQPLTDVARERGASAIWHGDGRIDNLLQD